MTDPMIYDVKSLLDKEKGDERILKQILRACENDEVISNFEINYVKKLIGDSVTLASQIKSDVATQEKSIVPEIIFSSNQNIEPLFSTSPRNPVVKSKNTKIFISVGSAIFAIIVILGLSTIGISNVVSDDSISIKTDLSTYEKGDIISISGTSISNKINLSIENQNGQLVWSEQLSVKNNNEFSTLTIAGGDGWNKSGIFTIKAEDNSGIKSNTFSFKI